MKVIATFTYHKIIDGRLHVAFLSKDPSNDPTFAPLVPVDQVLEGIRKQIDNVLQDDRIDNSPITITIEAGR